MRLLEVLSFTAPANKVTLTSERPPNVNCLWRRGDFFDRHDFYALGKLAIASVNCSPRDRDPLVSERIECVLALSLIEDAFDLRPTSGQHKMPRPCGTTIVDIPKPAVKRPDRVPCKMASRVGAKHVLLQPLGLPREKAVEWDRLPVEMSLARVFLGNGFADFDDAVRNFCYAANLVVLASVNGPRALFEKVD